jgi:hypothetical protein
VPDEPASIEPGVTSDASSERAKLVAHTKDGQIYKGFSRDFDPDRGGPFHLVRRKQGVVSSIQVKLEDLKALFHVKTWGRKDKHMGREGGGFPPGDVNRPPEANYVKTVAEFFDGEKICGFTRDYDPSRTGFYLVPADPEDNNSRIYVLNSSLVNIQLLRD